MAPEKAVGAQQQAGRTLLAEDVEGLKAVSGALPGHVCWNWGTSCCLRRESTVTEGRERNVDRELKETTLLSTPGGKRPARGSLVLPRQLGPTDWAVGIPKASRVKIPSPGPLLLFLTRALPTLAVSSAKRHKKLCYSTTFWKVKGKFLTSCWTARTKVNKALPEQGVLHFRCRVAGALLIKQHEKP